MIPQNPGFSKPQVFSGISIANRDEQQSSILEGRCVSIGQPISYWPFLDILRAYFGLGEDDDEATRARKVTEAITQLIPQGADEALPLLGNLLSIKYGNELDDRLKFAGPEQIRQHTLMRLWENGRYGNEDQEDADALVSG